MGRGREETNKPSDQKEKYQTIVITIGRSKIRSQRLVTTVHEGGGVEIGTDN